MKGDVLEVSSPCCAAMVVVLKVLCHRIDHLFSKANDPCFDGTMVMWKVVSYHGVIFLLGETVFYFFALV